MRLTRCSDPEATPFDVRSREGSAEARWEKGAFGPESGWARDGPTGFFAMERAGRASSNNSLNDLPPAGGFTGESATKDEMKWRCGNSWSVSCSLFEESCGGAWERMRWRFGLLGEGETGSPRRRFRARETAVVDTGWPCEEDA
jgi:hypothetical protein